MKDLPRRAVRLIWTSYGRSNQYRARRNGPCEEIPSQKGEVDNRLNFPPSEHCKARCNSRVRAIVKESLCWQQHSETTLIPDALLCSAQERYCDLIVPNGHSLLLNKCSRRWREGAFPWRIPHHNIEFFADQDVVLKEVRLNQIFVLESREVRVSPSMWRVQLLKKCEVQTECRNSKCVSVDVDPED